MKNIQRTNLQKWLQDYIVSNKDYITTNGLDLKETFGVYNISTFYPLSLKVFAQELRNAGLHRVFTIGRKQKYVLMPQ